MTETRYIWTGGSLTSNERRGESSIPPILFIFIYEIIYFKLGLTPIFKYIITKTLTKPSYITFLIVAVTWVTYIASNKCNCYSYKCNYNLALSKFLYLLFEVPSFKFAS